MPVHIRVSGTWKECDAVYIRVGGVWKEVDQAGIRVGGVWKDTLVSGPTVSPVGNGDTNFRFGSACYAGVQFNTSGIEYEYTAAGSATSSQGNWLDSGLSSEVWVEWTRTGGTLGAWNSINPGTIRRQLSSTWSYRIIRSTNGTNTIAGYFKMYDAASGGNTLWTGPTATWSAEAEIGGCPLCCFTPDTLVSMARGIDVQISSVREGDEIMGLNGTQAVGEVIVRYNVPIFPVTFEDGRVINVSPDHPLQSEEGPASLFPQDYKDLGTPAKLRVGSRVFTDEGNWLRITKIGEAHKEPVVYTFSNSLFYANGLLVY